jgi:hypothetical protein
MVNILPVFASGKEEGVIPDKIDTTAMSGLTLFIVGLFNDQRLYFALFVTVTMAVVGISIAFLTDIILKSLGLQVSKIVHHE